MALKALKKLLLSPGIKKQKMYYVLLYKTVLDYKEKRTPFRSVHLDHAKAAVARGELVLGGALENPANEAILVFKTEDPSTIEQFAQNDPYVINGVVIEWEVRPWMVVVGTAV